MRTVCLITAGLPLAKCFAQAGQPAGAARPEQHLQTAVLPRCLTRHPTTLNLVFSFDLKPTCLAFWFFPAILPGRFLGSRGAPRNMGARVRVINRIMHSSCIMQVGVSRHLNLSTVRRSSLTERDALRPNVPVACSELPICTLCAASSSARTSALFVGRRVMCENSAHGLALRVPAGALQYSFCNALSTPLFHGEASAARLAETTVRRVAPLAFPRVIHSGGRTRCNKPTFTLLAPSLVFACAEADGGAV